MKQSGPLWLFFLLSLCLPVCSAGFQLREIGRPSDYIGSKPDGISIDPDGRLKLASSLTSVWKSETDSACWTVAVSGDTVYTATAEDGKVYRYADGKTDLLFDSPQIAILSLLPLASGKLLAGSAPDGIIYSVERNGQSGVFARTASAYIWELMELPDKSILAAAGLPASVLRFDSSGKLLESTEIKADHIRTMVQDTDGGIWLGTANPARVYHLRGSDLQLVHETGWAEISAMGAGADGIWFATVASPAIMSSGSNRPEKLSPRKPEDIQPVEQNSVWFIDKTRIVSEVWSTTRVPIFDLEVIDNKPHLVCGGEGYLVRIDGTGRASVLAVRRQEPLTCLTADGKGTIWTAGATGAELYRYSLDSGTQGNLESVVIDAGASAVWGRIRTRGEHVTPESVQIETRTGNAPEPDSEWSDWALIDADDAIQSPPGRYLQWNITLKKKNRHPVVDALIVSLKTGNRPPFIQTVDVYPVAKGELVEQPGRGRVFQQNMPDGLRVEYLLPAAAANGLSKGIWMQLRGMRTIAWQAGDPDSDPLEFKVEMSSAAEKNKWFLIAENVIQPLLSFDSTAYSDGLYRIRVLATDKPLNPHGDFKQAECTSPVFEIDNTPPFFRDVRIAGKNVESDQDWTIRVTGSACDAGFRVARLEYSLDTLRWHDFTSADGLPDQANETFDLHLSADKAGTPPHQIFLRVTDSHENVTTITVPVD